MKKPSKFKFIDLFAGIGGFHQAMTYHGGECVFTSEIDEKCQEQYKRQFKKDVHGDINLHINDIPEFDVLCGGFPCQTFSKAGNQEGFDDELKGQLFFKIVEILQLHPECKFIILENVRNLADQERFWNTIQSELKALDFYITEDAFIKSPTDFGFPQNRDRVYILGIKKSLRDDSKMGDCITESNLNLKQYEKKCKIGDAFSILNSDIDNINNYIIPEKELNVLDAWENFRENIIPDKQIGTPIWLDYFGIGIAEDQNDKFYLDMQYEKQYVKAKKKHKNDEKLKLLIDERGYIIEDTPAWKRNFIKKNREFYLQHNEQIDAWYAVYHAVLTTKGYRKFEWNCGPKYTSFKNCIIQFRQSGLRIKKSDFFPSLVAIVNTPIIWDEVNNVYRRLTVREAANLQNFTQKYNFICDEKASYKQLGNSVNVRVIKIITEQLFNLAKQEEEVK